MASKVSDEKSSNTYYQSVDHLGSTNVLTDDKGEFYEHIETFPDGSIWVKEYVDQSGVNATYTNYEMDVETKLFYAWARYYDAQLGKFISTDPAMQHTNLYMYCRNNPLSYIDPTGMVDCRTNEDAQNRKYYGDNYFENETLYKSTADKYAIPEDKFDKVMSDSFSWHPDYYNPSNYVNNESESGFKGFTFHIGLSASGGTTLGGQGSIGVAFSFDWSDGLLADIGAYASGGGGTFAGLSGSLMIDVGGSLNRSLDAYEEASFETGGSVGLLGGVGYSWNKPLKSVSPMIVNHKAYGIHTISIGIKDVGPGVAESHGFLNYTGVANVNDSSRREKRK